MIKLAQTLAVFVVVTGIAYVLLRRYVKGGVCHSKATLTGKTVIITGANTGIGKETAIDLAKRNAKVILACRSPDRGRAAERDIRLKSGSDNVVYRHLDLASLASVRRFAEDILQEEPHIDILINNAGVSVEKEKTEDGFEMDFGVNHLGHFLLTNLLLDKLKEAPSARIITVSSSQYTRVKTIDFDNLNNENNIFDSRHIYCQTKLENILFTRALAKRLRGTSVTANSLHPGLINSEFFRNFLPTIGLIGKVLFYTATVLVFKTSQEGAQTSIYCAVSQELEGVSGKYFMDCKEKELETDISKNDEIAEKLWKISSELVGLKDY